MYQASVCVLTHTSKYHERNVISSICLDSLKQVVGRYELIIFDNTEPKLTLGAARNQMIRQATQEFLVISDDDIFFLPGWLEECLRLVNMGDRFMSTPLHQPRIKRWEMEPFCGYRQNRRTGSSCMVMRRSAFEDVGEFDESLGIDNCGKRYANAIARKGYSFLIPVTPLASYLAYNRHSYV